MRDRDRFWWAMLSIGMAFCMAGVLLPYFELSTIEWDNPFFTTTDDVQFLVLAGFLALVCLGFGTAFALMSVRARARHARRVAALNGDDLAMPLATARPDPARAPDVTGKPLELLWRAGKGRMYAYGPILLLQFLILLISAGIGILEWVGPIISSVQPSLVPFLGRTDRVMSLTEIVLRIAGTMVFIVALTVLFGLLIRVLPVLFGRPFGVTATAEGMEERTQLGSLVHIAWNEMRLLEVSSGAGTTKRGFAAYAVGKRISWTEYTGGLTSEYIPAGGVTTSEMTLRQSAVLDLIAAKTGLTPRTLAKALESKPAAARDVSSASVVGAVVVVALIVAGLAVAEAIFPITPYAWVNWASVAALGLAAALIPVAAVWSALTRTMLPADAAPPSAGAPSLDAPGVAYTFTWRTPLLRRLAFFAFGALLAVNLAPGAWFLFLWLLQLAAPFSPELRHQFLANGLFFTLGRFMLGFVISGLGLAGLALIYAGIISATARVRANADGLRTGRGRREQLMPWSSAQDISWGPGAGGRAAYLVKGDVPTLQISWPAGIGDANAAPPDDGALPIGPDELAALVAARIGKPIRVRR